MVYVFINIFVSTCELKAIDLIINGSKDRKIMKLPLESFRSHEIVNALLYSQAKIT